MRAVPTRDTSAELRVVRLVRGRWRYTRSTRDLPGRPDLVLTDAGVAVFVDGCFWHGCPRHYKPPRNNAEWWAAKIEGNRRRDRRQSARLRRMGWSVVRLMEHETDESVLRRLERVAGPPRR